MIKTIIIDDETKARETIAELIKRYCKNIRIVAEAHDVKSGIFTIKQHHPDVVLLDIKMPDGTGFDLLRHFDKIDFKIIFITAYEEYAIKAFKFSAFDYLLKPIDVNDLVSTFEKIETSLDKESSYIKLHALLSNIENISKDVKKIVLKTSDSIHVVNVQDILRCESSSNYTRFYFVDGKKLLVSKTLKEFDEILNQYGFFRAHQSHLVNMNFVKKYEKGDGGFLIMKDGSSVPVSIRKKEQLLGFFEKL